MTTYKAADITSREQAQKRLEVGEVFYFKLIGTYTKAVKIFYDASFIALGMSPYRYGTDSLKDVWDLYERWYVVARWYKNIPATGILCWVSDRSAQAKSGRVAIVNRYVGASNYPFRLATSGGYYRYATPLTQDELKLYGNKDGI